MRITRCAMRIANESTHRAAQRISEVMSAKSKIPPNLEPAILEQAGKGLTSRAIADWLKTEHGVVIDQSSVVRHLRKVRVERSEVARAVVREKLAPAVVADIDILSQEQEKVRKLSDRLHGEAHAALDISARAARDEEVDAKTAIVAASTAEGFSELALKASDRVKTLTHTKLSFSGAAEEDPEAKAAGRSVIVVPPESDD